MNQVKLNQEIISIWNNCTETERVALLGVGMVSILSLSYIAMQNGYSFKWGSFSLSPANQLV